ncbi:MULTISPECIES: bifunctional fucokinase/fucose-1-phosphate guanylyltransferase [unclassified Oceanispirochaeta]|uniref:bifunctional fucokinase/fucose-1-phosphate guanylyltransferase n=1 Tax=unclassified Oceanispirochaeta TaxID=2635722 RepID=UPI000E0958DF|nr:MULTISPECIES: bifunctional fucokinase/fucose-1-phosphate guanylyltransferase [unclassified Oceanispirochaeta]MBF9017758.1 bifunctional fucokinase/L-fucose-1-P-guanylyltransferase [Oceanispirochaeta sp. M2]NPD74322.1 bifunctional fucokinase/L-fucose-1-P-guanylyltransferase [Oceanispirochaeta sp. M1]RDG29802.1 bifunctional fucokinase/L-fucose-1-P-guanylyltransferase [Oceanispirochaeta sp. M1]
MKYLVSLPESTSDHFHQLASLDKDQWFCTSDPNGGKVGSGGGTAWLLYDAWKKSSSELSFSQWISTEKRILIHGGGQSRRLPAYASMGKLLLPMPVFRWERGQRLNQTLLDLQKPLLDRILDASADKCHTLIASGDAYISTDELIPDLPDSDVICFGLSVDPSLASRHGVFVTERNTPESLKYMLQKPSIDTLRDLARDNLFFIDIGIWLLSDRALNILMKKSGWLDTTNTFQNGIPDYYDMYGNFGLALGENPFTVDDDISSLSVAIKQIPNGAFYHLGTSPEIISSSLSIQNKVTDQKEIWSKNIKPHPAIFIQNSDVQISINENHGNLWIENSNVSEKWSIEGNQLLTGIPKNSWNLTLPAGISLDISPIGTDAYAIRPYGISDAFRGKLGSKSTKWMSKPFLNWMEDRNLSMTDCSLEPEDDIQDAALFPVLSDFSDMENVIKWMLNPKEYNARDLWIKSYRMSATDISCSVNFERLEQQRKQFRDINWLQLAENSENSVFFQIDLDHAAHEFAESSLEIPERVLNLNNPIQKTHTQMFASRVNRYKGLDYKHYSESAFEVLQNSLLINLINSKPTPIKNVFDDQIVWSRSPVRIDLAGGWTDTPPYSVLCGGNVVNVSLELNGQPPLQAFIRPSSKKKIVLSSIDLGVREVVTSFEELKDFTQVGSPFAIPKAALCLAGFHPDFCSDSYPDLITQLNQLGCGIEISLLAAIPKGSGMGTSSILASTILGALSDFCSLDWDHFEICSRTLALEQLLTTGGGWQDQYGGVIPGIKLLQTEKGWNQIPKIRWLPDRLFTEPEYQSSMLLYYTGITRVAKNLLAEIVEGMFLNERDRMMVLKEMKQHTLDTWEAIQLGDFELFGKKVARSWNLNNRLDADTTNPEIEKIIAMIDDLSIGYKLPGAGGGGYLYIVAKDPEAAQIIKKRLEDNPLNSRARFVQMRISNKGMQVSRS